MTHHPAAHSPHSSPSEQDCLQAEFVAAVESGPSTKYTAHLSPTHPIGNRSDAVTQTTASALATFEPTLQATDSFEFNYVDRPVPPPQDPSEPSDSAEILARLFTPWSLGGLFLLLLANGLLTTYSFSYRAAPVPVAINGFSELPPVNLIAPSTPNASGPSLAVNHLSQVSPQQNRLSSALSSTQSFGASLPTSPPPTITDKSAPPLPPPPTVSLASRLFPPAINPQQAMISPSAAPVGGYPTYSTARANAPQPPQPPNTLPTVSVRPAYQLQPASPLPPPPPLSPASVTPPIPSINPPSLPSNTAQNVEGQMRQQLPNQPTAGATSALNSFYSSSPPPGTKSYNQSSGATQAGTFPTQQLVQELESLNQAP